MSTDSFHSPTRLPGWAPTCPHAHQDIKHPSPWPLGLVGSPRTPVRGGGRLWLGPPTGALCAGITPCRPTLGHGRDMGREGPPLWGGNCKPSLWTDSDPLDLLAPGPSPVQALGIRGSQFGAGPQAEPRRVGRPLGAGPCQRGGAELLFKSQTAALCLQGWWLAPVGRKNKTTLLGGEAAGDKERDGRKGPSRGWGPHCQPWLAFP